MEPPLSSDIYLNKENKNVHKLKSHTNLPSQDKESNCSSQDIGSNLVLTEVDFTLMHFRLDVNHHSDCTFIEQTFISQYFLLNCLNSNNQFSNFI